MCRLSCRIGFGEVRRRDSRTEELAAFGIGFRVDTSPPVGSCAVTLGCRRVTETEKQRLKEKCSGPVVAWSVARQ